MSGASVVWIERLEDAPTHLFSPIVWIARQADTALWPLPPAEAADLADAARAKREAGAGRVLRRRLLRALTARIFTLHPGAVRFTRDALGRPGLDAPAGFISTASCKAGGEHISVVALSPLPIGVDLEAGENTAALIHWTLTEAYLKAIGRGLTLVPEAVRIEPAHPGWRLTMPGAGDARGEVRGSPALVAATVLLGLETCAGCAASSSG